MGDRTWATLRIGGTITEDQLTDLVDLIFEPDAEEQLREDGTVLMYEINYGTIDEDLDLWLRENNLSFSWEWGDGGSYGTGIFLYRAHDKASATYPIIRDVGIGLTLDQASDPVAVKETTAWSEFDESLRLHITD